MEATKAVKFPLIKDLENIDLVKLKAFPFWISTPEMDMNIDPYCAEFPEDFSRRRLSGYEDFYFWTSDLIELAEKHNGILFVCEGSDEIVKTDRVDGSDLCYPAIFVHMRFKTELDRMAAIGDIRKEQQNVTLAIGQYPTEPEHIDWWDSSNGVNRIIPTPKQEETHFIIRVASGDKRYYQLEKIEKFVETLRPYVVLIGSFEKCSSFKKAHPYLFSH
jgi:hypothetical protein